MTRGRDRESRLFVGLKSSQPTSSIGTHMASTAVLNHRALSGEPSCSLGQRGQRTSSIASKAGVSVVGASYKVLGTCPMLACLCHRPQSRTSPFQRQFVGLWSPRVWNKPLI